MAGDAWNEYHPKNFKKLSESHKLIITDEIPSNISQFSSYAYALHSPYFENACNITTKHYHCILPRNAATSLVAIPISCIYACFKLLIYNTPSPYYKGNEFQKLVKAIEFNDEQKTYDNRYSVLRRKLPRHFTSGVRSVGTQSTGCLSSVALDRYQTVINGPYGGEFAQIIDCLLSGYGRVENQNHSMLVKFSLDAAPAQCFCADCCDLF